MHFGRCSTFIATSDALKIRFFPQFDMVLVDENRCFQVPDYYAKCIVQ